MSLGRGEQNRCAMLRVSLREAKPRALVQEARYARFFLSLGGGEQNRRTMLQVSLREAKPRAFE